MWCTNHPQTGFCWIPGFEPFWVNSKRKNCCSSQASELPKRGLSTEASLLPCLPPTMVRNKRIAFAMFKCTGSSVVLSVFTVLRQSLFLSASRLHTKTPPHSAHTLGNVHSSPNLQTGLHWTCQWGPAGCVLLAPASFTWHGISRPSHAVARDTISPL